MSTVILWHDDAGAAVSLIFDVDEQETHDLQNVITDHPVEDGKDISDNVRPQLDKFTVVGYVTDTPLFSNPPDMIGVGVLTDIELQIPDYPLQIGEAGLISAGIGALSNAIFGKPKVKATLFKFPNFKSRKRATYDLCRDARDNARVCRVLTSLHEYENMEIEQITITRAPADGGGAVFSITLKEVDFVSSELVDAPEPAEVTGSAKDSTGSKNTTDDKNSDSNDTAALRLFNAGKGFLGIQ